MAARIPLSLLCGLLLCATIAADEKIVIKKAVAVKKKVAIKKEVTIKKVVAAAGAGGAVRVVKNTDTQRAAAKKLAEALLAQSNAAKALEEAEKAAAADSGEAKQLATEQLEKAKAKLEQAKKDVVNRREESRKAATVRAVVARSVYSRPSIAVREVVDPQDPVERFALLLPGGPVVVVATMTVDGQPFRIAREELISEMLDLVDRNKDGQATWDEALKNNQFTMGRVRIINDDQRNAYIRTMDKNENEQVDRAEVRQFVAQYFQGPAFNLGGGNGYRGGFGGRVVLSSNGAVYRGGGQADVRKLLDTDSDGVLDEKEIAAASERLKSRDADDNDLLDMNEIAGGAAAGNTRIRTVVRQSQAQQQAAVLLGPATTAESLMQALQQQYKNDDGHIAAGSFSAVPKLFEVLDKNEDGQLAKDEVLALNDVKPHIELAVDLGKTKAGQGLTLKSLASELTESKSSDEILSVELPGVKLSLVASLSAARTANYDRTAQAYLARFDKDSNGYLDKVELTGSQARMMEMWDGDDDGKVFAKEIVAGYARMQAPQQSQIRANAANQGNSLFQALDQSGDSRLSLREMRTAHERIKTFDENKDGRVTEDEIPVTMSVTFGVGNASYSARLPQRGRPVTNRPAPSDGPAWFTRMDRNGDGDLTLKEFLGDTKEFKQLDANGDGFIEPKEAKAATASKE